MSKPNKDQTTGTDDPLSLSMTDEEFETMMKGFSDEELLAYMENVREAVAKNPAAFPWATQQRLDDIAGKEEIFRKNIHAANESQRQADIATATMNRSADRLLAVFNEVDKSKGN